MVQISLKQTENRIFTDDLLPILLYAGQISEQPSWTFPSHKHEDLCEIIYISEGEGQFIINNKAYQAQRGDLLIYNQGVLHEERSNPEHPLKTYFCGVGNLSIVGSEPGHLIPQHLEPVIHAGRYSFQVENYISTLFEELESQVIGYETVCQHTLVSLIISVIRILNTQMPSIPPVSAGSIGLTIKEFIDENYTQDIPLNKIANRLYISPHYLSHTFKKETGHSPIDYLIQRRIGEAQKLLLNTSFNIQEISQAVGYENANYFSMMFKKVTGESPSTFRKKQLKQ